MNNETLLKLSLETAVMLRIAELEQLGREQVHENFLAGRDEWLELIAHRADVLLHGGGERGEVARVHTALVNAIAHFAFWPGGITIFDLHFEAPAHA